ncbi:hypothetical protein HN014_10680 [Aquimarina sp. TRL1]|uniref:hypothetical protein n=1 Tax=Aquimarina sp. (strain TRL1) TaxID=2736252 RepID=UPI00158CDEF6|nr:hypothetical protein [Aquimarina sp. TRL1]QKX05360.1 hypothetical protein HN014_10680 [Aquimarina sp. TRL1]
MKRKLLQEKLVFNQYVFDYYFADALKNGVLGIENQHGKAKMDLGVYYLNDVPKPNMAKDQARKILWGLIMKYKTFYYSEQRFKYNPKYYEYEPDSKTWDVYNSPLKQ